MNRRNQKATTYFVILSLLIIGIVYAFLQANLQINGIAKIKSNSWDIHFNNVQINENSVSISTGDSPATIDSNNNCKIEKCLPSSCVEYPYTNKEERLFSLYSVIGNVSICPVVYEILEELKNEYNFR